MGYLLDDEEEKSQFNPQIMEYFRNKGAIPAATNPAAPRINPLEDFSDEKRQAAVADAEERQSGLGWAQLAAGVGDAIAGRSSAQTAQNFDNIRKGIKEQTVGDFDKRKESAIKDIATKKSMDALDPNSKSSVAFRKAIETNFPKIAQQYGDDWQNVTVDDQESIFKPLQLKETIAGRNQAAAIAAGQREDARADRNAARQEKADTKREERDLSLAVPGYERTGEVLPKTEEAMKFRKATAVSKQLSDKLNRMRDLVKSKGSFEWGGDAGSEMESLATEIQLLGKSPELYELGVLAGPDLSLLQKITADPSSMSSLFTRDNSRLTQIDSQLKSIDGKLGATASSMGYKKADQKSPPRMVKIRDPKGIVRSIPVEQAQAAIGAGGVLVDKLAGQ